MKNIKIGLAVRRIREEDEIYGAKFSTSKYNQVDEAGTAKGERKLELGVHIRKKHSIVTYINH